jgi:hypothetical protein
MSVRDATALAPAATGNRRSDVMPGGHDISPDSTSTALAPTLDALEMFKARCDARAYLHAAGDLPDLHDAVDALQDQAKRHGLIDRYGQDAVQRVIADAVLAIRAGDTPA